MNGLEVKNNKLHNAARQLQIATLMLLTVLFTSVNVKAQSTTIKLPTTDNTSDFSVKDGGATTLFTLSGDGSLLSKGYFASLATVPSLGAGTRMWWFPRKAAFRVGYVDGTQWDGTNVGQYSFASGYSTTASGSNSTAMGYGAIASGSNSTAMGGHVSTNSYYGSFIIGDASSGATYTNSTTTNQMMMRFDGGYVFYTTYKGTTGAAAFLNSGQSSWSTTSDSTKKYAFLPVNGERVLSKIGKFNLRSWSYKGQDKSKFRHYGPMAQEFFNAFGNDKYGVAGNDTTINQADFEGINLIAIQALKKRTDELKSKTEEIALLKQKVNEQQNQFAMQQKQIAVQQKQINELNKMKTEFTIFKKAMAVFIESSNKANNTKVAMNK